MRLIFSILITVVLVGLFGCSEKNWDDHYKTPPATINSNVWDAIKGKSELSNFVAYVKKYKLDTLFTGSNVYAFFIPNNAAMDQAMGSDTIGVRDISYLISKHFVESSDIQGKRKIQTLHFKFATFENINGKLLFDGVQLKFESPLYRNGKYFVMDQMARPKPNLYEYFATNVPALKNYIDSRDSIIIDPRSIALGFDKNGKTIYDTIAIKYNTFELGVINKAGYIVKKGWFEVTKEFRAKTATFVYPKLEKYQNALTQMAQNLGGNYHDYKDIPMPWQNDVLIPFLLKHGTFLNMLEASEIQDTNTVAYHRNLRKYTMKNIQNDSIVVSYKAVDPYLCSNGIAYDYENFSVPDTLYSGSTKFEGEWLDLKIGSNKYKWKESLVTVTPSPYEPVTNLVKGASNDSVLTVTFAKGYKGPYNLQFQTRNLFPRKYRMVIGTNMDLGGIYDIEVNGIVIRTFDYYDYVQTRGIINSVERVTPVKKFSPNGRYNRFDCYVEDPVTKNDLITEYGKATLNIVYKGPARGALPGSNVPGLSIDYIEFVPVNN
jgi:hypothetical protein